VNALGDEARHELIVRRYLASRLKEAENAHKRTLKKAASRAIAFSAATRMRGGGGGAAAGASADESAIASSSAAAAAAAAAGGMAGGARSGGGTGRHRHRGMQNAGRSSRFFVGDLADDISRTTLTSTLRWTIFLVTEASAVRISV
jgi:hypothetical protein